ncbi:MAG: ABC transporter permease [Frisingicoccus sp.]|uniref:ABC transporter permease n=1 Tax=Frisingicoccus sp. TaxID=1918627 RepID=UPI002A7F3BDA|nr:ABC transporter permease [Frisingicoccus sp.]MDY4835039.1 ABC transporter permease [Frisingicoccus sp.]
MFVKLAIRNVRRQIRNYLIYFITVVLSIALLFAVNNLSYSDRIQSLSELSTDIRSMFTMVTVLSCLVTALVLSYATGFMLKLRRREFGMYLTLGMTRRNIQTLFVCETGLLMGLALVVGMGFGLVIFQLVAALFASILEIPFAISAYSLEGVFLTIGVSIGLFLLSTLASRRYLRKVTVSELLKEPSVQKSEKHPVLWCILSVLTLVGFIICLIITYRSLMAAFHNQDGVELLLWLAVDLLMVFLTHFTWSRTLAGMLLRSKRLKNRGTNTVVLRGLSEKMTVNSLLIGALATLLVFSVAMSNVAFSEKVYTDLTIEKECPYDVMALVDLSVKQEISMDEGKKIIERYSPITEEQEFSLYSLGEATLCSTIMGYKEMGMTDLFMPLSQFNTLLTGCGYEPVSLEDEYLLITDIQGICDIDFSNKPVIINGQTYTWAGSSKAYPDFARRLFVYFVVPDRAVDRMDAAYIGAAYTLENHRPDAEALRKDLSWMEQTGDGIEEKNNYAIQEYWRIYNMANAGTLISGALYISTVFVCMALAILSVKVLSTLEDERRRFAVLYRLGADAKMQKTALFQQIGAFFFMPFMLPLLMTVPIGTIFGEVYEIWNLPGLSGQRAMQTSVIIALAITGIYALYFIITYRVASEAIGDGVFGSGEHVND